MKLFGWFRPKCKHEWVIGRPTNEYRDCDRKYPAVCRWCNKKTVLSNKDAHVHSEWQRLEIERAKWPKESP